MIAKSVLAERLKKVYRLSEMQPNLMIFAVILFCINCLACVVDNYPELSRQFDRHYWSEADKAIIAGDYQTAEQSYLAALETAKKMEWTDGVVMSKRSLGHIAVDQKKYEKAEGLLKEAKDICLKDKNGCTGSQLGSVYDSLVSLYIFHLKDINKAEASVNEVISLQNRLSADKRNQTRLYSYADEIKSAGFEQQAEDLIHRANAKAQM